VLALAWWLGSHCLDLCFGFLLVVHGYSVQFLWLLMVWAMQQRLTKVEAA